MKPAEDVIGAVGFSTMAVRPGDTTVAMGISDLPVVATSHLLNLMESACCAALAEFLDSGETSYLLHSDITLSGSATVGDELRANARCVDIDGREVCFECEVFEGERLIASAELKRATVERISFLARTAAQSLLEN